MPAVDANGVNCRDTDFNRIRGNIPNGLTPEARAQINGVMGDVEDAFNAAAARSSGSDAHLLTRRTNSAPSPLLDSDNGACCRNHGQQIRAEVDRRLRENMTPQQQVMFDQANSQPARCGRFRDAADSNGSVSTPGAINRQRRPTRRGIVYGGPGAVPGDPSHAPGTRSSNRPSAGRSGGAGGSPGAPLPILAGMATTAVVKPLLDWVLAGGAGTTGAGLGLAPVKPFRQRTGQAAHARSTQRSQAAVPPPWILGYSARCGRSAWRTSSRPINPTSEVRAPGPRNPYRRRAHQPTGIASHASTIQHHRPCFFIPGRASKRRRQWTAT